MQAAVRAAPAVRCVAAGHSFTPIHLTDGTLLTMDGLQGVIASTPPPAARRRCPARPSARSARRCGRPGYALANQGDIDTQGIAGAIGTCTHGSGLGSQSFSASLRRARLVTATGDVIEIGAPTTRRCPPCRRRSACSA